MNRIIPAFVILLFIALSVPAYSLSFGAGVTTYYSYWNPAFIEQHKDAKIDPAILAGPIISLQFFDRFLLSAQVITSITKLSAEYTVEMPSSAEVTVNSEYRRSDAEISLMYLLTSRLKCFAGYKRIELSEYNLKEAELPSGYTGIIDYWDNAFAISGPGAGIMYTIPLAEKINATLSTSMLYFNMDYQGYYLIEAPAGFISCDKKNFKYSGYGNNSSVTFSYYMPDIDTVLNLGARCQYLKYSKEENSPELGSDLNYGVTCYAMYFFN